MPIRGEWRHHVFHSPGFRPLGLCLRHPQVIALPILEARLRHITLSTQNGGSYAQVRVIMIDVEICKMINRTSLRGHITSSRQSLIKVTGQVPRQSWTPLHVLNHLWTEPPLQHEDTGQALHQWNGRSHA